MSPTPMRWPSTPGPARPSESRSRLASLMATCPDGHESTATDYCDVCGILMAAPAQGAQASPPEPARPPARAATPCPRCGAPGMTRFCEACGYSAESEAGWTAVITASRPYYETVLAGGVDESQVPFPDEYAERRVPLTGSQLRIGRRSVSMEVTP